MADNTKDQVTPKNVETVASPSKKAGNIVNITEVECGNLVGRIDSVLSDLDLGRFNSARGKVASLKGFVEDLGIG